MEKTIQSLKELKQTAEKALIKAKADKVRFETFLKNNENHIIDLDLEIHELTKAIEILSK